MLKTLYGEKWRRTFALGGKYNEYTTEEDYLLLRQLLCEFKGITDTSQEFIDCMSALPFVKEVTEDGKCYLWITKEVA